MFTVWLGVTYRHHLFICHPHYPDIVSICPSVSLESSVMGHDEMLQVLKEKMRLEGQLESLSSEANQVRYHIDLCNHSSFFPCRENFDTHCVQGEDTIKPK